MLINIYVHYLSSKLNSEHIYLLTSSELEVCMGFFSLQSMEFCTWHLSAQNTFVENITCKKVPSDNSNGYGIIFLHNINETCLIQQLEFRYLILSLFHYYFENFKNL